MKRLRSLYSSLKFWWRLCPLRYRGQGQVAVLYEYDEFDFTDETKFPKDLYTDPLKYWPSTGVNRYFSLKGHVAYGKDAAGLVYIVLPKDKL